MNKIWTIKGFKFFILATFLNIFIDLGHKIVLQDTIYKVYSGDLQLIMSSVLNAIILLPFIVLFIPSGFLSDRFPKNIVMKYGAIFNVGVTLGIMLSYYFGLFWFGFMLSLMMSIQSAFYSPAKFGYIKDIVGENLLTWGNGVIYVVTVLAMISAISIISPFFEMLYPAFSITPDAVLQAMLPVGIFLFLLSVTELYFAFKLPKLTKARQIKFDSKKYFSPKSVLQNLRVLRKQKVVFIAIINIAIFWAISLTLLSTFPIYAKNIFGEINTLKIHGIIIYAGLGVIIGSIFAARSSKNYIETGLIPLGGIIMFVALFVLPTLSSSFYVGLAFFAFGFGGALSVVPFNTLIQFYAADNQLGQTLAWKNLVQAVFMLALLSISFVFAISSLHINYLFIFVTIISFCSMTYVIKFMPFSLVRFLISMAVLQRYKLNVEGFDNLPKKGGVLLLGNHISFIDWAIVQMAVPRKVYFVMERSYFVRWYINIFMDFFGVIPVTEFDSKEGIDKVRQRLKEGSMVCIFPEGTISRHGQLNEFKSSFTLVAQELKETDAVILPFFIRGLWGTIFSRSNEQFRDRRRSFSKKNISIAFGEKLSIHTPKDIVKNKVFEMSFKAWEHQCARFSTIGNTWINAAKKGGGDVAVVDSNSGSMNYTKLLALSMLLSGRFAKETQQITNPSKIKSYNYENKNKNQNGFMDNRTLRPRAQCVGVMLPASLGSILTNLSLILAGKIVVNLNFTADNESVNAAISLSEIEHIYTSRVFLDKLKDKGVKYTFGKEVKIYFLEDILQDVKSRKAVIVWYLLLAKFAPKNLLKEIYSKNHDSQSIAAILFSSGSEDKPKGVMLSHLNILSNVSQIADVLHAKNDDVILGSLPPFHAFGLTVGIFMPLLENMLVATHPDPTDSLGVAKAIALNKVTIMCATSTILGMYTRNQKIDTLMFDSLRLTVAGAEKLKQDVKDNFSLKFAKLIYEGYGATETTPVVSVNLPNEFDVNSWQIHKASKDGSVGMPLPGTAIRIVDPNTMESLPTGEDGLILIGGHQVMIGYLKDKVKTKEVIVELDGIRWYKSGDKGHLDTEGFLHITDRYSRFAKIGGEMISLAGVEEHIAKISRDLGTFDEVKCLAVALEDNRKGEKIVLLLEEIHKNQTKKDSKDNIAELISAIKTSKILNIAKPSLYLEVESIPMLGSGKADLKGAKDLAAELLAKRLGSLV